MTISEVTATVMIASGGVDAAVATCPGGSGAVSGGFSFDGLGEVFLSQRFGGGWAGAAQNFDSDPSHPPVALTVYAYCSPGVAAAPTVPNLNSILNDRRARSPGLSSP